MKKTPLTATAACSGAASPPTKSSWTPAAALVHLNRIEQVAVAAFALGALVFVITGSPAAAILGL